MAVIIPVGRTNASATKTRAAFAIVATKPWRFRRADAALGRSVAIAIYPIWSRAAPPRCRLALSRRGRRRRCHVFALDRPDRDAVADAFQRRRRQGAKRYLPVERGADAIGEKNVDGMLARDGLNPR